MTFNLLEETWIPVLYRDGSWQRVGIREALAEGGGIWQIAASNPMDNVALLRLLLAVLRWCKASVAWEYKRKGKTRELSRKCMKVKDVRCMVKRRLKAAGLPGNLPCDTFRARTITGVLESGVNPDDVQDLAGHADPRTTRLYDRRKREVTRNIVERISI